MYHITCAVSSYQMGGKSLMTNFLGRFFFHQKRQAIEIIIDETPVINFQFVPFFGPCIR